MERSREMMKVSGRVLDAPMIAYGQQRFAPVNKGSWSVGNFKLAFPILVESFLAVCFEDRSRLDPQIIK